MRLALDRVGRWPGWPRLAVAAGGVWLVLAAAGAWLCAGRGGVSSCHFKRLTHLPCPTCGLGRAFVHAAQGRFLEAWLCNPLAVTLLGLAGAVMVCRLATGRQPRVELGRPGGLVALGALAALGVLNWAYLIACIG